MVTSFRSVPRAALQANFSAIVLPSANHSLLSRQKFSSLQQFSSMMVGNRRS
uniref:Uncharacterized protein n=1 Tax=Arundo donax TaxID=35708 RepID=A0A0A9GK79_ARUDO